MDADETENRVELSYGENYTRLASIKGKYDPDTCSESTRISRRKRESARAASRGRVAWWCTAGTLGRHRRRRCYGYSRKCEPLKRAVRKCLIAKTIYTGPKGRPAPGLGASNRKFARKSKSPHTAPFVNPGSATGTTTGISGTAFPARFGVRHVYRTVCAIIFP
jgi:hypothetical protein